MRTRFKILIYLKGFGAGACGAIGPNEQIFGADEQVFGRGQSDQESEKALPAPMHSWDQMKPHTVYEKAVQDFTEIAQQLARLDQHFRQASFSEFEMLMGLDDEVLKRYGLPKPTVKRALLKVYQTVVLDQQR